MTNGRGDGLANQSAKSKSILREHLRSSNPDSTQIPVFYIFYKNINYIYVHWKHLARRFKWTQKKRALEILVLPIKSKTLISAHSLDSLCHSHTQIT